MSKISPFLFVLFWIRYLPKTGAEAILKKYGCVNIVIIIQEVVPESFFKFKPFVPWSFNRHLFFGKSQFGSCLLNQERKQYINNVLKTLRFVNFVVLVHDVFHRLLESDLSFCFEKTLSTVKVS